MEARLWQRNEESTDEFLDCEDYAESQAVGIENHAVSRDTEEGPALPQYLYTEDEEPGQESTSLGADLAMSFATSVTSSFSAPSQTSSKRTRASHSPPSNSQPHKKHCLNEEDTPERVSASGGVLHAGLNIYRICCAAVSID